MVRNRDLAHFNLFIRYEIRAPVSPHISASDTASAHREVKIVGRKADYRMQTCEASSNSLTELIEPDDTVWEERDDFFKIPSPLGRC